MVRILVIAVLLSPLAVLAKPAPSCDDRCGDLHRDCLSQCTKGAKSHGAKDAAGACKNACVKYIAPCHDACKKEQKK
jgi:hypothetical protein